MKREVVGIAVVAVLIGMLMGVSGCSVDIAQAKVIAQNAGLFSAVGWIAMDNPNSNEVAAVELVLVVIETKAADVQAGATYTEVIYPELIAVINKDVEAQYRPLCKAGSLALLGGLDMLFAANPEWKAKQDVAIEVVDAFIFGAKNGLSLAEDHPIMASARATAAARAKAVIEPKK